MVRLAVGWGEQPPLERSGLEEWIAGIYYVLASSIWMMDMERRDFACFGGFLVLVIEKGKGFWLEIREGGPRAAR